MRKIGYVIIIMVLIFSMGACGNEKKDVNDTKESKENIKENESEIKNETKINNSETNESTSISKKIDAYIKNNKIVIDGDIVSASIRSGTTGENVANLQDSQLEQLILELTAVEFETDEYVEKTGWSYSIEFAGENSSATLTFTQNELLDKENRYICKTNLDELIEKYIR